MRALPSTVKLFILNNGEPGIFASGFIPENTPVGICFVKTDNQKFEHGIIPTVLGGLIRQSEAPNCMIINSDKNWILWTQSDIFVHQELTVDREMYGV